MTDPYQLTIDFVEYTNRTIFLTGKAGSGKTTLLKEITSTTRKNFVILAPTGIAAINAEGVTIHSFFTIPTRTFLPTYDEVDPNTCYNIRDLRHHTRYRKDKIEMIRNLDMIIIDEVSMCRADIMDAIDHILRNTRRNRLPFGGVQLLLIGDLYQLPPVVKDREKEILQPFYPTAYFFHAQAFKNNLPLQIELTKIYRQSDPIYINLLNHIRNNEVTLEDIHILNSRYQKIESHSDEHIIITTHNYKADAINQSRLNALPDNVKSYKAKIVGEFQEWNYPCDQEMQLKTGAKVMFIKNDSSPEKHYYNGKLGYVKKLTDDLITISCNEQLIELERETWRNIRYTYNTEEEDIEEEELGSYNQFPLRLAWAITVHKSQGLTFEKAILDVAESFAAGQVYVALSRCTSLEGMILSTPVSTRSLAIEKDVIHFLEMTKANDISLQLERDKLAYLHTYLVRMFDFTSIDDTIENIIETFEKKPTRKKLEAIQHLIDWKNKHNSHIDTASRFHLQLSSIFKEQDEEYLIAQLKQRVEKAIIYFTNDCYAKLYDEIKAYNIELGKQKQTKKLITLIDTLLLRIEHTIIRLYEISIQGNKIYNGTKIEFKNIPDKPIKKRSKEITLEIFNNCKNIEETARIREMALSTIEGHLADAILDGTLDICEIMDEKKLNNLCKEIGEGYQAKLTEIRSMTGNKYSFSEIRMVVNYLKRENGEVD